MSSIGQLYVLVTFTEHGPRSALVKPAPAETLKHKLRMTLCLTMVRYEFLIHINQIINLFMGEEPWTKINNLCLVRTMMLDLTLNQSINIAGKPISSPKWASLDIIPHDWSLQKSRKSNLYQQITNMRFCH